MEQTDVFFTDEELQRLSVQRELMKEVEQPVLSELFSGRSGLQVLDLGCNDGSKTFEWFSDPAVSRVIGLEYNEALVKRANSIYGGTKFSFFSVNAESKGFPKWLRALMIRERIRGFDIIYLSFVLLFMKDPKRLIRTLLPLLAPKGKLVIIEADDGHASLAPHGGELLQEFLEILAQDPFAGKRHLGGQIPEILAQCGGRDIRLHCTALRGDPGQREQKERLFQIFLSLLPEDIAILRKTHPEDPRYQKWERWVKEKYETLKRDMLREDSVVRVGIAVVTCSGGDEEERRETDR